MAQYTGKQSIYDAALGHYGDLGFGLNEPDDHILELRFKDKIVAVFNQTKANPTEIKEQCDKYLSSLLSD